MNIKHYSVITATAAMLCVLLLCPLFLSPGSARAASAKEESYAVTLISTPKAIDISKIPRLEAFNIYTLYIITHKKGSETWYDLRMGFYSDKASANKVSKSLRRIFKDAHTSKVSAKEHRLSTTLKVKWSKAEVKSAARARKRILVKKAVPKGEERLAPAPGVERQAKALMSKAGVAVTAGKHKSAIALYKKVLGLKGHKYLKPAQELMGFARERGGEFSKAKAEYLTYLILYPKGKDAERVRQRLSALETARAKPRKKLRKAKKKKNTTRIYGSFSQFYHRDDSYTDLGGNVINRSSLSNDFDLTIRRKTANMEYSSVIVIGYEQDFLNNGEDNRTHLSRAYFDVLDRKKQLSFRLGRQSKSTGGVLGRFDGLHFSYQAASHIKLNMVTGFPVNSAIFKKFLTNKYFYGVSVDLGTFFDYWDYNLFIIKQKADQMSDREAVGMETRYFHRDRSLFMLIDFDTSYNVLNTWLISGNIKLSKISTLNTSLDMRRSPILTTSNALQGQLVSSLKDLKLSYTEEQIRSLALDRTAKSFSLLIGLTREISKKLQISGDFTISELTGTPASGGVEAMPSTGYDYFLSTQLVGSGIIKTGDTAILGLRYSDTASSKRMTADINTRYPISRKWRVNPRLRINYSWQLNNSANRIDIRPSFRSDYYLKKKVKLEFDAGVEWGNEITSGMDNDTRNYFLTFGYRKNF